MRCYAVIDTNVIVSALLSSKEDAATVQVISRMLMGDITPVYSEYITGEYREVLARDKFRFDKAMIEELVAAIERFGVKVSPEDTDISLPDMKDVPFYQVVLEKQDVGAYLVTGNIKHFPKEPFVVTARQLLELLDI